MDLADRLVLLDSFSRLRETKDDGANQSPGDRVGRQSDHWYESNRDELCLLRHKELGLRKMATERRPF